MAETKSEIKVKLETKTKLSEIEELRKENERLRREKELLELEKEEIKQFEVARKKLSPAKFGAAEIREMVPPFDPPKNCISSKQWIEILENFRNIYEWDDRSTMLYASFRLEKGARVWYLGRGAGIVRWNEFKDQFIETFPSPKTKTRKSSTASASTTSAATTSAATTSASTPPAANLSASILPAAIPTENLTASKTVPVHQVEQPKSSRKRRRRDKIIQRMNKDQDFDICFLCRKTGHFARECTYYAAGKNPNAPCYQMRIVKSSTTIRNDSGLIKNDVTVDGIVFKTFIDLGSDCTTLKLSDAKRNNWLIEQFEAQLNGFNGSTELVLGKFRGIVKVDEVAKPIDIFVVPNYSQSYSLIVGRNFLNSPDVCVIKKFGSLEVKSVQI